MTRWSTDSCMFIMGRMAMASSPFSSVATTGVLRTELTDRIADSGALMIAVKLPMPNIPRLEMEKVALDLRQAHKDDFFSVPEDNPLEDFLQTAEETTSPDSDPEQAAMAFICKRLKLNYGKLSEEERKWLKRIAQKSDLLKNPKPQRGRK